MDLIGQEEILGQMTNPMIRSHHINNERRSAWLRRPSSVNNNNSMQKAVLPGNFDILSLSNCDGIAGANVTSDYQLTSPKKHMKEDSSSLSIDNKLKRITDEVITSPRISLELSTSDFPKENESSSSSPTSSLPTRHQFLHQSSSAMDITIDEKQQSSPYMTTKSCLPFARNTAPTSSNLGSDEFLNCLTKFEANSNGFYTCHICNYSGPFHAAFKAHLQTHYDHHCNECDYTSRTEGRLKRHMKDFHSEVPPENFSGKTQRILKPKLQKCKQCDFVTDTKEEFWAHQRSHIKTEKLLECDKCNFVTEYKHHLEYHMRNHTGSKPYKCLKCNYECVNKSMLNSHMKSHTNVYQYRCSDCNYATKYCHSLKLHLQKLSHKPDVVLNSDGSLPEYDNSGELMNIKRGPNAHSNPNNKAPIRKNRSMKNTQSSKAISKSDSTQIESEDKSNSWPLLTNFIGNNNPIMSQLFHQQLMKMSINFFMNSSQEKSTNFESSSLTLMSNQCKICLQSYSSLDDLFAHLKEHVEPIKSAERRCQFCSFRCFGEDDHNTHIRFSHSDKL